MSCGRFAELFGLHHLDAGYRRRGGRALKTVYVVFETKVGLLRAVWEARFGVLAVARAIVKQLSDGKALATGLTIPDATDILWTLNHPTVWHLTVRARGWSPKRYERWLGDVLCTQLLGRAASSSG